MRSILALASSLALLGSSALADDVTVHPVVPVPGVVVEHHDDVVKKEVRHDSEGCKTKHGEKEKDNGDHVSKTVSNC